MDFDLDEYLKELESQGAPETSDATSDVVKDAISSKFNPQALQEAQQKVSDNRLAVNLSDAGSDLGYAIAGVARPKDDSYADLKKTADAPLQKVVEGEKLKLQHEKMISDAVKESIRSKNQEGYRNESNQIRREGIQANKDLREAVLGANQEKTANKKAEDDAELNVPGYVRDPSIRPLPAEAQKVRDGVAELNNFQRDIGSYLDLVQKNGGFEAVGEDSGRMSALSTGLKLQMKNLEQLGVLAGPDMGLLEKLVNDPTGMNALITSNKTNLAQLKQTKDQTILKALGKIKARGYSPAAGNNVGYPKYMRRDGKRVPVANEQEEKEAAREGWQ